MHFEHYPSRTRIRSRSKWLQITAIALVGAGLTVKGAPKEPETHLIVGQQVATGMRITPTAAPGSTFEGLNPDIAADPSIRANQGVTTATSPDGLTLLVLTSGYNYWADANYNTVAYDEYVFVYDISGGQPRKIQVIKIPNTFMGLAWNPLGHEFYVAGGVNDNVYVFERHGANWLQAGAPISLGHAGGLGLDVRPLAAGLAVNQSGTRLLVANLEKDSISLVDLEHRSKVDEIDLRPGKNAAAKAGIAGGEFPLWLAIKGDHKAYVSSLRDREIVVLDLSDDNLTITRRIGVTGNPNRMLLDRVQGRLIAALDNSDSVAIIDTASDRVAQVIDVNAPFKTSRGKSRFTGSHPNSLALSPDDNVLFVTQGGTNSVAVVPLNEKGSSRIGLIPTGWYPNSVSISADGGYLYVVNAIGSAGPNPQAKADRNYNQYVLQMRAAGLLAVPMPSARDLRSLTKQVLFNNGAQEKDVLDRDGTMAFLSTKITCDLHREREPHLRSGARRSREGQRRSVPHDVPRTDQPEPPSASAAVCHPGQLLLQRGCERRRLGVEHGGPDQRLHREYRGQLCWPRVELRLRRHEPQRQRGAENGC